jgi:hypothetical protein
VLRYCNRDLLEERRGSRDQSDIVHRLRSNVAKPNDLGRRDIPQTDRLIRQIVGPVALIAQIAPRMLARFNFCLGSGALADRS